MSLRRPKPRTNRNSEELQEGLEDFDDEIQKVYESCVQAGLSHDDIRELAKPLLCPIERQKRMELFKRLIKWISIVGLLFFGLYVASHCDFIVKVFKMVIALTLSKVSSNLMLYQYICEIRDSIRSLCE